MSKVCQRFVPADFRTSTAGLQRWHPGPDACEAYALHKVSERLSKVAAGMNICDTTADLHTATA
jgi:hypothetical protein